MRELLRQRYGGLLSAWRAGLSAETGRAAAAFSLLVLGFFAACLLLPDLRETLVALILGTLSGLPAAGEDGTLSALALFLNNLQACAFILLYGLVPFLRLPAMTLGLNAMMLGGLAAWYAAQGVSPLVYLALILPHGVFELPALVIALGTGLYICRQTTGLCRGREGALPLPLCLLLMSRVLLLVLVPLLTAAALIEAYVTPMVASLFF
ncbi:stage II sporulation protein M [uncultured Oscillibacter sp.]|uniref:stage II sporulation protein M n=1 Tax=uncultured Oscillibacter sp. TaxID=876091 RepID=UPI0025F547F1|nr:stage II sporulation protein M [uncultured Oscillibacter sp.]